jgi:protein O-GlcNAc transferase
LRVLRPLNLGFTIGFYLAYHGKSNKELKSQLADLYRTALGTESITTIEDFSSLKQCDSYLISEKNSGAPLGSVTNKITVAFISRFFTAHSIGRLMQGVISQLDKNRFEVIIFMITGSADEEAGDTIATRIIESADEVIHLPADLKSAHRVVNAYSPHIIIYPEIGMDPFAYFMALSRLAPVQVCLFSYYISCKNNLTSRLLRLLGGDIRILLVFLPLMCSLATV